jgi:hypothetical protein
MKFVGKVLSFLVYLGIFQSIMLVFAIGFAGFCLLVAAFMVYTTGYVWYTHSPLSFAVFPVVLLFGIPTLGWLIYGIATTKWSDIKAVLNEPVWIKT